MPEATIGMSYWAAPVNVARGWSRAAHGDQELILNQNMCIERVLPHLVLRQLSDLEIAEYHRPFLRGPLADIDVGARSRSREHRGRRRHRGQLGELEVG